MAVVDIVAAWVPRLYQTVADMLTLVVPGAYETFDVLRGSISLIDSIRTAALLASEGLRHQESANLHCEHTISRSDNRLEESNHC